LGLILPAQESKGHGKPTLAKRETTEPQATGTVKGLVTFQGEIPKSSVSDDAGVLRELLQVNRENAGLRYAMVWLVVDSASVKRLDPPTSSPAEAQTRPALMDQMNYAFVPRVPAVKFTNSDAANHNARTSSSQPTNEFNVFTGVDGSDTHRFAADPHLRPIRLGCDIHPWMRGWIDAFDPPHFAARRRCRGPDDAGSGVHDRDVHRLPAGRAGRPVARHDWDFFAGVVWWLPAARFCPSYAARSSPVRSSMA